MTTATSLPAVSIPRAARAALQWRLLLLWVLWMLVPTIIISIPVWSMLGATLDYSVHADATAQRMDMTVFADLMAQHGRNSIAFSSVTKVALVATLLISPLLSAMAAAAARSNEVLGLRALMAAGLSDYLRMFRMLLWSVVPLGLAAAIGGMAMGAAESHASTATLESSADMGYAIAGTIMVLLLALAHATVDAGRAALALERRRTSVIKAWWHGCGMLLRRPLATFGAYAAITAVGMTIVAGLVILRVNVTGASLAGFVAALLVVQLTVAVVGWMRSARLFAMVAVARMHRG